MSFYEQNQHQFTVPTTTQTMEVAAPQHQVPSFSTTQMVYSRASIVDPQDHGSILSAAVDHGVSVNHDDHRNPSCSYECVQSHYAFNGLLPPGIRFQPTDFELIYYYLIPKIKKEVIPSVPIRDVNLYEHSPNKIAEMYPELNECEGYFFTPRDRKYPNGDRPNRGTGCGYWKATGSDKPIINILDCDHRKITIGSKKTLVYYEGEAKSQKGIKTNWIMHEYCVIHEKGVKRSTIDKRLDDFILCRIYKKGNNKSFQRQPGEVLGSEVGVPFGFPFGRPFGNGTPCNTYLQSQQLAEVQGLIGEVGHPLFGGNETPGNTSLQSRQPAEVQGLSSEVVGHPFGNGTFGSTRQPAEVQVPFDNIDCYGNFNHSGDAYPNNFQESHSQLESYNIKDEFAQFPLSEFDNFTDYSMICNTDGGFLDSGF